MNDGILPILAICVGLLLGTLIASAQNMSPMGMAKRSQAIVRSERLSDCMKLVDDIERQRCVENIK